VVEMPDLKSRGHRFKSHSDHKVVLFSVALSSTPLPLLLCLLPVGILIMLCSFPLFVQMLVFIDPEKPHWGSGLSVTFF